MRNTKMRSRTANWAKPVVACLPLLACAGLAIASAPEPPEGDAAAGKEKAGLCAACHGPNGISVNPLWPSLAGQQEAYLDAQIRAFREGVREEITMKPFVENLSDQDVADLAAYYAGLSPCP